jgi:hypothetical protein
LRRLIDAGVSLEGASDHGVSEALYLRDPDKNGIELSWDRPKDDLIARDAYRGLFKANRLPKSNFPLRYNIAPTDQIPIVRIDPRDGEREVVMARATLLSLPPNTGQAATAANFMPGIIASMPNLAVPFTFSGVSRRLAGVPISVKSLGSLSSTLSGTGSFAAASTRAP